MAKSSYIKKYTPFKYSWRYISKKNKTYIGKRNAVSLLKSIEKAVAAEMKRIISNEKLNLI